MNTRRPLHTKDYMQGRAEAALDLARGEIFLSAALASFDGDPPDTESQLGYMHELQLLDRLIRRRALKYQQDS